MQTPLTHQVFSQHLNSKFRVQDNSGNQVVLELTEVSELLLSARQERFSILFLGPNENSLGQGMREFEHDHMGKFELFLVPIGRNEKGTSYEAVFNRLRKDN